MILNNLFKNLWSKAGSYESFSFILSIRLICTMDRPTYKTYSLRKFKPQKREKRRGHQRTFIECYRKMIIQFLKDLLNSIIIHPILHKFVQKKIMSGLGWSQDKQFETHFLSATPAALTKKIYFDLTYT